MTHNTRQAEVLELIKRYQPVSASVIRRYFNMTQTALNNHLHKLFKAGLIRSERDPDDRRERRYYANESKKY